MTQQHLKCESQPYEWKTNLTNFQLCHPPSILIFVLLALLQNNLCICLFLEIERRILWADGNIVATCVGSTILKVQCFCYFPKTEIKFSLLTSLPLSTFYIPSVPTLATKQPRAAYHSFSQQCTGGRPGRLLAISKRLIIRFEILFPCTPPRKQSWAISLSPYH